MQRRIRSAFVVLFAWLIAAVPGRLLANYPIFSQRFTADPSAIVVGGRVYLFLSQDKDTQSNWDMTDFTVVSSDDLVNWTDHGEVFDARRDTAWATLAWAPAVVAANGRYYLYYTNGRDGTGVSVADNLLGPYTDPLGEPLVVTGTFSDPAVLIDDGGSAFLHVRPGLWARLDPGMTSLATPLASFPNSSFPDFKEGGIIHKIDGRYHLSYASAPLPGYGPSYGQSVSDLPTRDFRPAGKWFWLAADNLANTHGDFFSLNGRWYMVYHNQAVAFERGTGQGFQRSIAVDRVYFAADATIRTFTSTRDLMAQVRYVDPYVRVEAETMSAESFIETEPSTSGGRDVTDIQDGDAIVVSGVDFGAGAVSFTASVASAASGGAIDIRLDTSDGRLVGSCVVPPTGGRQSWREVSCPVSGATGVHDVHFRFVGGPGDLFNFDWWRFAGVPPSGGPPSGRPPSSTVSRTVCLTALGDPLASPRVFLMLDNEDGTWSFQGLPERDFLAVVDPVIGTIGRSASNSAAARFALISNPDRSFSLLASNDRVVVAEPGTGSIAATFDPAVSGSPRLLPGSAALFTLDACRSGTAMDCDLNHADVSIGKSATEIPAVYGSSCAGVDASMEQGGVAIARPGAVSGARFDTLTPATPEVLRLFQRGCGCDEVIRLSKDRSANQLVLE